MRRPAILAGSMALPKELVDTEGLKKALSIFYKPMGAEEAVKVELFRESGDMLLVPRQFGLSYCKRYGIPFEDHTSLGAGAVLVGGPAPRDYQVAVLDEIVFKFDRYYDFLFRARTGWGKTAGSLILAQRLGVQTLVLVDQENLKDQWIATLTDLFGLARSDIGEIQGKKCTYEGKPVTVGMVQTLSQKEYSQEVYDAFGLLLVDEVHIIGAPTFSKVLMDFTAAYRLGVSATPNRRDGLRAAVEHNLGKVRVHVADQHDRSSVIVKTTPSAYSEYSEKSPKIGRYVNEVSDNSARNLEIAFTVDELYSLGQDTLVLSDRIEHLQGLMDLCYYLGVPEEDMGLYTGYSPLFRFEKNPKPARRPDDLVSGAEYCPVHLTTYNKRVSKKEFARIKDKAKVIFATYGMFAKGVDVPRLSAGIDATPRSQAEQMQGRILRVVEGKPIPTWVTFVDTLSIRSIFSLAKRVGDYVINNSAFYEQGSNGELTEWQPDDLREALAIRLDRLRAGAIEKRPDGSYTARTRNTPPLNVNGLEPDIKTRATTRRVPPPLLRRARPAR